MEPGDTVVDMRVTFDASTLIEALRGEEPPSSLLDRAAAGEFELQVPGIIVRPLNDATRAAFVERACFATRIDPPSGMLGRASLGRLALGGYRYPLIHGNEKPGSTIVDHSELHAVLDARECACDPLRTREGSARAASRLSGFSLGCSWCPVARAAMFVQWEKSRQRPRRRVPPGGLTRRPLRYQNWYRRRSCSIAGRTKSAPGRHSITSGDRAQCGTSCGR